MSVPTPPRRTTRGDKFVGSSDEEFCNEPPQLRKKTYRKKKSAFGSASEGLDSGVESRASSPRSMTPKVQITPPFKNSVRTVVEKANTAVKVASRVCATGKDSTSHRQIREPEKKTMCGRRLPSAAELAAHFGGRDYGEYDNGSVTVVRQYGIDLFSFK
ncbi:hypothetical protein AAVH_22150 [Aphelenchoides avenae]|nr:hypothetical protein AAVH_22150 [Aphelenchus avenae]